MAKWVKVFTFMRSGHFVSFSTGVLDPVVIVNKEVLLLFKEVIHLLKRKEKLKQKYQE